MNSFRGGGMQVHAVPDDERAFDSSGRQLPWGYAHADSSLNRKQPLEKGPFGRATNRRSMSRSKTATPSTREELQRKDNLQYMDQLFIDYKSSLEERQPAAREQNPPMPQKVSTARPTMDAAAPGAGAPAGPTARTFKEPTEVMLYGFGNDYQYSAIDFYERASNGSIYEDYDRQPPNPRYSNTLSTNRATIPRSLSQAAIRAINTYQGGDHWIKVTFDSPEAAEMACHYSPHVIHGFLVHAELYRGVGPAADAAIPAETVPRNGPSSLQPRRRVQQSNGQSSNTMPARTAPDYADSSDTDATNGLNNSTSSQDTATASGVDTVAGAGNQSGEASATTATSTSQIQRPLRIAGAKRAVLLPASDALLPVAPWRNRTFGQLPVIGSLFGGNGASSDIIGPAVPRKEDGTFDWSQASFWWRWCWWIDYWFGTNICGLSGDD